MQVHQVALHVRQLTAIFMQVLSVDAAEDHHEDHNYEGRMHLALLCCRCFETGRMTGRTGRHQPTVCICFGSFGAASCWLCTGCLWLPSVVRTTGYVAMYDFVATYARGTAQMQKMCSERYGGRMHSLCLPMVCVLVNL